MNMETEDRKVLIADAELALKKLALALGEDAAARVFSAAVTDLRRQTFCHIHGDIKKIRRPAVSEIPLPPDVDHGAYFGRKGKSSIFLNQPYQLSHDQLLRIMKFCENNDLQVEINSSLSWWFPSKTLAVIFKPKEEAITQEESHGKA